MERIIKNNHVLDNALKGEYLINAVLNNNPKKVLSLLFLGADINYHNVINDSPLTLACKLKNKNMIDLLISRGANYKLALSHLKKNAGKTAINLIKRKTL